MKPVLAKATIESTEGFISGHCFNGAAELRRGLHLQALKPVLFLEWNHASPTQTAASQSPDSIPGRSGGPTFPPRST